MQGADAGLTKCQRTGFGTLFEQTTDEAKMYNNQKQQSMNFKTSMTTALVALASAFGGAYFYHMMAAGDQTAEPASATATDSGFVSVPGHFTASTYAPTDFTQAAETSVNAVVHVKVMQNGNVREYESADPFYRFFFGPRIQQQTPPVTGSGSGVIISQDGYIITNNHVIDKADKIEVVLNDKRSFEGKLIGTDPSTDIALIKIEATALNYLTFGNSDATNVGEWVLAVGNPFNLTSTVTAGIISAKSRSIGIISPGQNIGIESFIQTDAAVNPGNSGGALVNTRGELIGINTAIASQTGSYTGYSFAVPSNIAQKVAADLKEYGEVQRGLLGITISEIDNNVASKLNLASPEGVFVESVADGGGAKEAGVMAKDIIKAVDGEKVNSVSELQEKIGRHRPGDAVRIDIERDGKPKQFMVTLRNTRGTTGIIKISDKDKLLGATFEPVSDKDKSSLRISYGLKIVQLKDGKLKENGIENGFIITKANRQPITSVGDFEKIVATASEGLFITGIYPNGRVAYYAINLED